MDENGTNDSGTAGSAPGDARLIEVTLDEDSLGRNTAEVAHERDIAIFDLLEENSFSLNGHHDGPYTLHLSLAENRLLFKIGDAAHKPLTELSVPLSPFRRLVKDYFMLCESYFEAIKTAPAAHIESLDQNRRGMHDEGSKLLQERLQDKVTIDIATARRLFTLLCALHWKG